MSSISSISSSRSSSLSSLSHFSLSFSLSAKLSNHKRLKHSLISAPHTLSRLDSTVRLSRVCATRATRISRGLSMGG
eukprot:scaffold61754_cov27-Phaeocystis_antarctica.AAC.1